MFVQLGESAGPGSILSSNKCKCKEERSSFFRLDSNNWGKISVSLWGRSGMRGVLKGRRVSFNNVMPNCWTWYFFFMLARWVVERYCLFCFQLEKGETENWNIRKLLKFTPQESFQLILLSNNYHFRVSWCVGEGNLSFLYSPTTTTSSTTTSN